MARGPGRWRARHRLPDALLIALLAVCAGASSLAGTARTMPAVCFQAGIDHWFHADSARVYGNLVSRQVSHYRSDVHPLFSLLGHGATRALGAIGLRPLSAVRGLLAAVAAAWLALFYATLRGAGLPPPDAGVFSALALCSAAAVLWFAVPESFPVGALSIVAPLCVLAWAERGARRGPARPGGPAGLGDAPAPRAWPFALASAASLAITLTNWMFGLLASAAALPWRRALVANAAALLLVAALAALQGLWIPSAPHFLTAHRELDRVRLPGGSDAEGIGARGTGLVLMNVALHSIVAPQPYPVVHPQLPRRLTRLMVHEAAPGSAGAVGRVGVLAWGALLLVAAAAAGRSRAPRRLAAVLGAGLLGQLVLHTLYAPDETFLFSLHYAPPLILLVALSALGPLRPLVLGLAALVTACAGFNNWRVLEYAADFARAIPPLH